MKTTQAILLIFVCILGVALHGYIFCHNLFENGGLI